MKRICEADLCCIPFAIYPHHDGGSFDCSTRRMEIDVTYDRWDLVLSVLLHEAIECVFALRNRRFRPSNTYISSDTYLFCADHVEFTHIIQDASRFIAQVEDKLHAFWVQFHESDRKDT